MTRRRRPRPYLRTILISLLALSLLGLLLPRSWTAPLMSLVQVLAPFQAATQAVADGAQARTAGDTPPPTAEEHQQLRQQAEALRHQVAALSAHAVALEEENALLTAVRLRGEGGSALGARGRLIPARVIAQDVVAWRSSRLIDAGTLRGVQPGAIVTSRAFDINQGEEIGLRPGLAVLLAETLVGTVEKTGTHTARVRLLSDITSARRVRIGRFVEDRFALVEPVFWLIGTGRGRMELRDVDRRLVQDGLVAIGDIVLSDPTDEMLPAALTIGKITMVEPDRGNPLLRVLTVEPVVPETQLQRVYVYDPSPAGNE
ncbi:MAG TPA: rod shape-determining protein MreC [Phycisphaerae bacterium]|nr:rod shape-determining protein MreC [Phycisphaerae bacterium]HNU45144.1 rod shape-determining protein MreC [Phycisphaerae bacterium]